MVIVLQVKSLVDTRLRIYEPLRITHFSFETSHFINVIILINNSLLLREPPTSIFQLYFHSLTMLKALPLMLLSS